MRRLLALVLVLYSGAAMAQSAAPAGTAPAAKPAADAPPTVGGKPLVQVKPRAAAKDAATKDATPKEAGAKTAGAKTAGAKSVNPKNLPIAKRLQACLEIEDGTKGRLDCYDTVFQPKPDPKAKPAKGVADCRFKKEEDERLTCFNGFAESIPQF